MNNIVPQHINQETLKSYYLYFDKNGDKSSKLLDILMDSLLEFVFVLSKVRRGSNWNRYSIRRLRKAAK